MIIYQELSTAIKDVLSKIEESDDFKKRLSKLIENYFDDNCQEVDISELIEIVSLPEDTSNEN